MAEVLLLDLVDPDSAKDFLSYLHNLLSLIVPQLPISGKGTVIIPDLTGV